MATSNSINPFPATTDRNAFGHWLSGLTDGEGCFRLSMDKASSRRTVTPTASFSIKLRADDAAILHLVRSFWQCGFLESCKASPSSPGTHPQVAYRVCSSIDLEKTVIPHFERYPLRAKKAGDFSIWKAAVFLMRKVQNARRKSLGGYGGTLPRWNEETREEFNRLRLELCALRKFLPTTALLPLIKPPQSLFD